MSDFDNGEPRVPVNQPDRSLVDDAAAAFEAGLGFLDELQQKFLHQVTGPDLLARFYGRAMGGGGGGGQQAQTRPDDFVLSGVSAATKDKFAVGAGARALEPARYLDALIRLHEEMRALADAGTHPEVAAVLERLGLQTVTA